MKIRLALICAVAISLLAGCTTLYKTTITITDVRNNVMNQLGAEYRAGRIDANTDARIAAADKAYRDAASVAITTLNAYKASGEGDPQLALAAVKNAVLALIDILGHYADAGHHYTNISKAKTL